MSRKPTPVRWTAPIWFCKWCKRRIVAHNIGSVEDRRRVRIVWVHLATNMIWCRPLGESTLIRTAKPSFRPDRKWSHA